MRRRITWKELFGTNGKDVPSARRKSNWEKFMRTAREDMRDYWNDAEGCEGCIHLERKPWNWCSLQGLPASVNPYLTMKHGMIDMACYGAGKEEAEQTEMAL